VERQLDAWMTDMLHVFGSTREVGKGQRQLLTDKDSPDGEWHPLLVDVRLVEIVEHAIERRDFAALVPNDGKVESGTGGGEGVDVFHPAGV